MTKHNAHHKKIITSFALLAMGLSFLAQITPLWLNNTNGTSLVICTAFGIETITIDENGKRIPAKQTKAQNHCVMCLNAALDTNIIQPVTNRFLPQIAYKTRWNALETLGSTNIRTTANAIRAPPSTT